MAIEWVNLYSDKFSLGIDWNASISNTGVTTTVKVYRYDAQNTDNYSGSFDEGMSEPDGSWGMWNGYSFGSGSGTRQIEWFSSRTYSRRTYDYTISYALTCNSSTGTYYNGWHTVGSKDLSWQLTIPKLDSYTVSYDANGGSNAPSSQTKWYGTTLSLSSQKPVRANYNFLGWSTSSTATSAEYLAGGSYTSNSGATLYAVWKLAAVAPIISSATFNRCTENGEMNAEGTYIKAVIAWAVDTKVITSNAGKVINITWSPATGDISSKSITVTGTSGTVTQILGSANFDSSTVYTFNSSITDTVGLTTSSGSRIVASVFHTFDIGNKGKSIGLGAVASNSSNSLTVGFDSTIINNDNVIINGETLGDFVTAQGTSGNWHYRKWHSGYAECCGFFPYSFTECRWWTDQSYVKYTYPAFNSVSYPFTFKEEPALYAEYKNRAVYSGIAVLGYSNSATTDTGEINVMIPDYGAGGSGEGIIYIHAFGKY